MASLLQEWLKAIVNKQTAESQFIGIISKRVGDDRNMLSFYRRFKKSIQQENQNLFKFLLLNMKSKGLAIIHG